MAKYLNSPQSRFFPCNVCGADVLHKALCCPECGADERTGLYGDEDRSAELGLPEDPADFSYDEFVKREFGSSPQPSGIRWLWWGTALLLLVAMIWLALRGWR